DKEIQISVSIEVTVSRSARYLRGVEGGSNQARDIGERTLSIVQKKLWRLRIPVIPADVADRFVDVSVDSQQVQITVQIDIQENASESETRPGSLADPG